MKRITHAWLKKIDACPEQRELFRELYPNGAEVCWKCFQEAQRKGLDVDFLACQLTYHEWSELQDIPYLEPKFFPKLAERFPNNHNQKWEIDQLSAKALRLLEKYILEDRIEP